MEIQQNRDWYNVPSKRPGKSIRFGPSNETGVVTMLKDMAIVDDATAYECDDEWSQEDIIGNNFSTQGVSHPSAQKNYIDSELLGMDRHLPYNKIKELNAILERRSSSPRFSYYREQPDTMNGDEVLPPQDEFEEFRQRALSLPHRQLLDPKSPNFRRPRANRNVTPRSDEVYVREATNSPGRTPQVSPRLDILKKARCAQDDFKHDGARRSSLSWGLGLKSDLAKLARRTEGSFKSHKADIDAFRGRSATSPGDNHHWREFVNDGEPAVWTPSKSPGQIEQRFLQLPESAEYDKIRSFNINEDGDIVNTSKGYVYRLRSEASPTPPNVDSSLPPSPLSITADGADNLLDTSKKRYIILIIGDEEVGKSSLIVQLQNCDLADGCRSDAMGDTKQIVPVLIAGKEVDLFFAEWDVRDNKKWKLKMLCAAIVVMYSVTNTKSFSTAADVLYQLRDNYSDVVPILLVANKMDLERQRAIQTNDGKELAKSYNCKFIEVSVVLGHETDELLRQLLLELRKYEKRNSLILSGGKSNQSRNSSSKKKRRRTVVAVKQRANSLHHDRTFNSFGSRLAKSCEDLFAKLFK